MKKMLSQYKIIASLIFFLFLFSVAHSATITSTVTGGVWTTGSTWLGGVVPATGDVVIIATSGSGSVQITGNLTQISAGSVIVNSGAVLTSSTSTAPITFGSLSINSGGTVTMYRRLIVLGASNIGGTINFGSINTTAYNMTFTGSVTLNSGAVWNETTTGAAATFSFGSSFTNNATTFTAQNTAHTFTGAGMAISGSTATTMPQAVFSGTYTNSGTLVIAIAAFTGNFVNNGTITCATSLRVTGAAIRLTNNGALNATTALSGTGGIINSASWQLNIGGTSSITTLANAGNINITGLGAITTGFSNFTNTGTVNLNGTGTISGITNNAGGIINLSSSGTITRLNNATATSTINISASTVPLITTLTATALGNTVNYSGTGQTLKVTAYHHLILSGGAKTFGAITIVGGNLTLSGAATATTGAGLTITGNLKIGDGTTFTTAGYNLIVTGTTNVGSGASGNFTISSVTGTKRFTGLVTIAQGATWNNSVNSAIEFRGGITTIPAFTGGTGLHTFTTNAQALTGTFSIPSLRVTGITLTNTNTLAVGTALSGTGSLNNAATGTLNIGGTNGTCSITTLSNSGIATLSGSGAISTPVATFANTGTLNLNGSGTIAGITNNANGILNLASSGTITRLINATATSTLNISASTVPAITTLTATVAGNTVNYNGVAQNGCIATTYSNLTLSGSGIKQFPSTPTVNGILSMEGTANITITTGAGVITYGAAATLQYNKPAAYQATTKEWITPFVAAGGIVIKNTGAITTPGAVQIGNNTSVPLNINTGATLTPGANLLTFQGDFINAGTLTNGSGGVTIAGTIAAQSIAGFTTTGLTSMTKTAGTATFTSNVSGVGLTLNGTGGTLNLGAGLNHTFTGTWTRTAGTLNGGSGTVNFSSATVVSGAGGTFNPGTGTVNLSGAAQTVPLLSYYNLALSGSGAKTLQAGTTSIAGNLTLSGTASATNSDNLTIGGNFTMGSGCKFTINPNTFVTVNGTLSNSAGTSGLVIASSAAGTGSLLNNTASVSATVERYIAAVPVYGWGWHFLSSPVASQTISPEFVPPLPSSTEDFYVWDEPSNYWINFKTTAAPYFSTVNGGTTFIKGRGYLVSYQNTTTKNFQGTLNAGTINCPLTIGGNGNNKNYNLVGNPYPCAIDWDAADAVTGWDRSKLDGSKKSYWVWNEDYGNYGTYIQGASGLGTGGTSNFISSGQGFIVKAALAGVLTMNDAVKVHDARPFLKSVNISNEALRLKISCDVNTYRDEAIVAFNSSIAEGGAEKFSSMYPDAPELWSEKNGNKYSINLLGDMNTDNIVPLTVKAGASGTYTLSASQVESFGGNSTISLEDRTTGTFTYLGTTPTYSFKVSAPATITDRFFLHFMDVTGIPNVATSRNFNMFTTDGVLNIQSLQQLGGKIAVIDMVGRTIATGRVEAGATTQIDMHGNTGVYIVRVLTGKGIVNTKVIVK